MSRYGITITDLSFFQNQNHLLQIVGIYCKTLKAVERFPRGTLRDKNFQETKTPRKQQPSTRRSAQQSTPRKMAQMRDFEISRQNDSGARGAKGRTTLIARD